MTDELSSGRTLLGDVAVAFSIGHLVFVRPLDARIDYFGAWPSGDLIAALVNVLIATAIAFAALRLRWGASRPIRRGAALIVVVLGGVGFSQVAFVLFSSRAVTFYRRLVSAIGSLFVLVVALLLVVLAGYVADLIGGSRLRDGARRLAIILFPFAVLHTAWAIAAIITQPPAFVDHEAPQFIATSAPRASRRVVFVVFDELDQLLGFDRRPSDVRLPNFDALRAHAVVADSAAEPGPGTLFSMPAITVGSSIRRVLFSRGSGRGVVTIAGSQVPTVEWSRTVNIFSDARQVGASTAIVGWFHPYCDIFRGLYAHCSSTPYGIRDGSLGETLGAQWLQLVRYSTPDWLSEYGMRHGRTRIRMLTAQMHDATTAIADTSVGLVFLHLASPHFPWIYDRTHRRVALRGQTDLSGYLGNLVVTDSLLGVIRGAIAASPLARSTTLIVTSDHHWRSAPRAPKADLRVPLFVSSGDDARELHIAGTGASWQLRALTRRALTEPTSVQDIVTLLDNR